MGARVGVLGTVEVVTSEGPAAVGGPKQRLVLSLLVVAGGRPLSMDRIVEGLWEDDPPSRAEASVQSYVSKLRQALEPDRPPAERRLIEGGAAGYRLDLAGIDLDADEFRDLVGRADDLLAAGRPEEALVALGRAQDLWRGRPFGEHAEHPMLLADVDRLEELQWHAAEGRCAAELALGRGERAVAELRALTRSAPYRERPWLLLGAALRDTGRPVDALHAVREGMEVLREGTGLEPGPALVEMEAELLSGPPPGSAAGVAGASRAAPSPAPATPEHPGPLARGDEFAMLVGALDGAGGGRGRAVAVAGEPGIGKTHLAGAVADRARRLGWTVCWTRCPEGADVPGLWPLRSVVDALLHDHPDLDPGIERLGPLHPGSGADDPGGPSAFAVGVAFAELLARAAGARPLLLVVDDAHWADAGTVRVLRHLVAEVAAAPVLVLLTLRDTEVAAFDVVGPLRADVARSVDGVIVPLTGLPEESVAGLLAEAGVDPGGADLHELHRRTGGNPFFLLQVASAKGPTPDAVHDVVAQRLGALPSTTSDALDVLALGGQQADARMIAALTDQEVPVVLDALDRAVSAGVLLDDGPGRYRFTHDLLREGCVEAMGSARRTSLHRRIAEELERRWDDDPDHLPARAWHLWRSATVEDPAVVFDVVTRAAVAAEVGDRPDEALERWQWAESLLASTGDDDDRFRVATSLAAAHLRLGDVLAGRPWQLVAARLARRRGDWAAVADAVTMTRDLSLWASNGYGLVDDEVVSLLDEAREQLDPEDLVRRALVASRLALELYYGGDEPRIDALSDEALELARRSGDARTRAVVLTQRLASRQRPHLLDASFADLDELHEVGSAGDLVPGEVEAAWALMAGYAQLATGDLDQAAGTLARAERLTSEARLPFLSAQLRWYRLTRLLLAGHLGAAEVSLADCSAFYRRVGGVEPESTILAAEVALRLDQGRPDVVVEVLRPVMDVDDGSAMPMKELLVVAMLDAGALDDAATLARELDGQAIARDFVWLTASIARAWSRVRLGQLATVPGLLEDLRPYSGRVVLTGQLPPALGSADYFLGLMEQAVGDPEAARSYLASAVRQNERLGARAWLARSLHALAGALGPGGEGPNGATTDGLRARARQVADQVDNPLLVEEIDR